MSALMDSLRLVPDEKPPTDADVPTCVDCGTELPWAGKGRRPTKCDEHRKKRGERASSSSPAGSNEKLAGQAADVLCQINDWLAIGAFLGGLHGTAGELAARQDKFREQAYAALLLDPALAKMILRGGAKSGKAALAMAYVTMLGSVAPTAVVEFRELRASRAAESAPTQHDEGAEGA